MKFRNLCALCVILIALFAVAPAWGAQADPPITVENAADVTQLALLEGHTGPVFTLAFNADNSLLISGGSGDDYTARLWDVTSASEKAVLEGHTAQIAAVGFNADGTQAQTASYDGSVRLWDAATGAAIETIDPTTSNLLIGVSNLATFFNSDGSQLAYFSDGGLGLDVIDLTNREQHSVGGDSGELVDIFSLANIVKVSPDGMLAAVEEADGGPIHLIDVETGTELSTFERYDPDSLYYTAIAISPDNTLLAAVDDTSSNIQTWNIESGEAGALLSGHAPNDDGTLGVYGLAFNPDSTLLSSASYDETVRIWDVAAGMELVALETSGEGGSGVVVWSPDGSRLASANLDGSIQLWGVESQ